MKIWHLNCEVDSFENLTWENGIDIDEVQSYDGRSKKDNWQPVKVVRMYDREYSNTPGLSSHIPVFDEKALSVVGELIENSAEILLLECFDGKFYAINVTDVVDCIDYKNSNYKTFRDGVRIMRFKKYTFIEEKVKGKHIFKIVDEPLRRPFVSDEFRQRIIDSQLTGFIFDLVWDSEADKLNL